MLHLTFTDADRQEIQFQRYHHPHPHVQRKMEALWLKAQGLPHAQIATLVGVSENTIRSYFRQYHDGGLAAVQTLHFRRPTSALADQAPSLEAHFRAHPPHSLPHAAAEIERLTGIRRSPVQVGVFLKRLGLRRLKCQALPARADVEAQAVFKQDELEPVLAEAQAGKRAVYFVDAAHFVLTVYLGFVWSLVRVVVRAPSGRQRFNVLGALNAISKQVITVTNTSYITAQSVCDLLVKLREHEGRQPVTVVLDNARYQRCHLVMELAAQLQIELLFLPTYSPNLNLIERLWKFVKKECLYSEYYADFGAMQTAIEHCLAEATGEHQAALSTLLTLKFQTLKPAA